MSVEVVDENFFIRRPAATCNKYFVVLFESLYDGQSFGLFLYLKHTVKACVSGNGCLIDADAGQQVFALLILHEEVSDATKNFVIGLSIPFKEDLIRSEDRTDTVNGDAAKPKDIQVVVPEFILDEESHGWLYEM